MPDYNLQELIEEYVFQREQNIAPEQALKLLGRMAPGITPDDRKRLMGILRKWETENRPSAPSLRAGPPPSNATQPVDFSQYAVPDDLAAMPNPTPPPPPPSDAIQPPPLRRSGGEPFDNSIECRHCGTHNPPAAVYCYSCGSLLAEGMPESTDQLYTDLADNDSFGSLSSLLITVRGFEGNPVRVEVTDAPLMVGRSASDNPQTPDIDMAPFQGKEKGVSRSHAVFKREKNTVTLVDNGSVNHTFINGEKIHPHEIRVVRDGDEIRFGRLITRVSFVRELRRL